MSSVVIFGGAALWDTPQAEADRALDLAASAGVNHIDVAPQYGKAEELIGPWLERYPGRMFIGCKTLERDRAAARADLDRSLERLRVKRLDLYQLHAVCTFDDLEQAMKPGGAIETLIEARERGLTRWLGITGHGMDAPAVHAAALERFDFDTVMFPIHPRLYADPKFRRDAVHLLDICRQKDVGVMIIKAVTRGAWGQQEKRYSTWYEPYDRAETIEKSVRFALSQPGVAGIPGAGDLRLLPLMLDAGERFQPMTTADQEALIAESAALPLMFE